MKFLTFLLYFKYLDSDPYSEYGFVEYESGSSRMVRNMMICLQVLAMDLGLAYTLDRVLLFLAGEGRLSIAI